MAHALPRPAPAPPAPAPPAPPPPRHAEAPTASDLEVAAQTVADAVEAARHRSIDPLVELLSDTGESPDADEPGTDAATAPSQAGGRPRIGRVTGAGTTSVLAVVLLAGAVAWLPARTANASITATSAAANRVSTLVVPPKTGVTCSWNSTTAVTMAWTNPNPTDSAQVLVATTSGGTTTVGATAAAGATSVALLPLAVTTVRYLSTRAVDGTWTSVALARDGDQHLPRARSTPTPGRHASFAGDGGAATAASLNAPVQTDEAPDGRVFIADSGNNRIRVVSTNGTISTFAGGTGGASACTYAGPVGLAAPERPPGRRRRRRRQRLHRRHRRQLHPQGRHRRQRHPLRRRRRPPPPATPPWPPTASRSRARRASPSTPPAP